MTDNILDPLPSQDILLQLNPMATVPVDDRVEKLPYDADFIAAYENDMANPQFGSRRVPVFIETNPHADAPAPVKARSQTATRPRDRGVRSDAVPTEDLSLKIEFDLGRKQHLDNVYAQKRVKPVPIAFEAPLPPSTKPAINMRQAAKQAILNLISGMDGIATEGFRKAERVVQTVQEEVVAVVEATQSAAQSAASTVADTASDAANAVESAGAELVVGAAVGALVVEGVASDAVSNAAQVVENIVQEIKKPVPKEKKLIFRIHDDAPLTQARRTHKARALLIGINYFMTQYELRGCIDDVRSVEAFLQTQQFSEIRVLADNPHDNKFKSPTAPTRENILRNLKEMVALTAPGEMLFVHYSGHAAYTLDETPDEPGKLFNQTLCPCDFYQVDTTPVEGSSSLTQNTNRQITDDELFDILVRGLNPEAKLRVVLDVCQASSALDMPFRFTEHEFFAEENKKGETPELQSKDIVAICGARDDKEPIDAYSDRQYIGGLTWGFVKTMFTIMKSENQRSLWTWRDVITSMRHKLLKEKFPQIPQICFMRQEQLDTQLDLLV